MNPDNYTVALGAYQRHGKTYLWVGLGGAVENAPFALEALYQSALVSHVSDSRDNNEATYELVDGDALVSFLRLVLAVARASSVSSSMLICEKVHEDGCMPLRPLLVEAMRQEVESAERTLEERKLVLAAIEQGATSVFI